MTGISLLDTIRSPYLINPVLLLGRASQIPLNRTRFRTMLEHQNCTFSKVEILNHNVGYIKFDAFPDPDICGPTAVAAMNFVAHTDALIFDLPENHGAIPAWWISWFRTCSGSRHTSTISPIATRTRPTNIGRFPGFPDLALQITLSTY